MFAALIFTIFPTILFYLFFNKIIKSIFLKLSFSWFCGQFIMAIITFLVAIVISHFTSNILVKAELITLIALTIILLLFSKRVLSINENIKLNKTFLYKIIILLFVFSFSYFFYTPHLKINNGIIYTSYAYWDFQWHAPLIQNFVYGDNFPPQNESFAGMPQTYHFFWGFLVSIYNSIGLDLVYAINYFSIISLFFLLLAIIGLSEELLKSFTAGILAVLLSLTSSSLRFIHHILYSQNENLIHSINNILTNSLHPFFFSFVPGNPYGYNGTIFNMFYFLAERQMVFAIIFLLFSVWVIYKRRKISYKYLIIIGALMGTFFLWHLYITIMALCAIFFTLVIDKDKKRTFVLFSTFSIVFILHILYFNGITDSIWFHPDIKTFPRFNFNFPTMPHEYPLTIANTLNYYLYAYGFKIIFLIFGLIYLWKKNKKILFITASLLIPTFILVNTVQLSPLSIYDNHKWLRPMNVIVDIIAGFALLRIFLYKKNALFISTGIFSLILLTTSGFIELPPFFNSNQYNTYVQSQSPLIHAIRKETNPGDIFLAYSNKEIQIAGRKVFLGDYAGQNLGLRKDLRKKIIKNIYTSDSLENFCFLTHKHNIDYVEVDTSQLDQEKAIIFKALDGENKLRSYINTSQTCRTSK